MALAPVTSTAPAMPAVIPSAAVTSARTPPDLPPQTAQPEPVALPLPPSPEVAKALSAVADKPVLAAPALAKPVIAQLKEFGRTHRGWLGVKIQEVSEEMANSIKKMQSGGKLSMSSPDSLYKSIQLKRDSFNKAQSDFKKKSEEKQNILKSKFQIAKTKMEKGKKKMQNGGSLSGLKASTKRVGPVDPNGAWTKVQEKTLAGARGKAVLKKDKELGATKMKMGGSVKKK